MIEVKTKASQTLSFKPSYLARLKDYAALLHMPLLIAWKFHSIWTLFDVRHLTLARTNFRISHSEAMKQNLRGLVLGDVAFKLSPGAGIHFEFVKEEILGIEQHDSGFTESWRMRVSDAFCTAGGSERADLHSETQQLLAVYDLQQREEHSDDRLKVSFEAGVDDVLFAHMALPRLLEWERQSGESQPWRRLLSTPEITRHIAGFETALQRALGEGVVSHIFHQVPLVVPDFLSTSGR